MLHSSINHVLQCLKTPKKFHLFRSQRFDSLLPCQVKWCHRQGSHMDNRNILFYVQYDLFDLALTFPYE